VRRAAAVCLCLLLAGCSALPRPREMGDMALLRAMGVDAAGAGVALTLSTDPRPQGIQGETQGALVLYGEGESLPRARQDVQTGSRQRAFFGYVDQVLLGEELARQSIWPVLEYLAGDVELGMGGGLWLVEDAPARRAVESGGEEGVAAFLTGLEQAAPDRPLPVTRTAGEVYADLLEWGCAYVPILLLPPEEGQPLQAGGYGVIREGRLTGVVKGEAARGLELLVQRPGGQLLVLEPEGSAAEVTDSRVVCHLEEDGRLAITCGVSARLSHTARRLSGQERQQLQEQIGQQVEHRLERAMNVLGALGTDCLGMGPRAGLRSPGCWQQLQERWPELVRHWQYDLTVQVQLES